MGGEPSMEGQVPELVFVSSGSVCMSSSVCRVKNRGPLFPEFRVISVFSFGVNLMKFFPADGVTAARFPNECV